MEIVVNEVGPSRKNIKITIPAEDVRAKFDDQINTLRKETQMPGFRAGKAPVRLLERKFGTNIYDELRRNFLAEGYQKAIKDNELSPISEPDFNEAFDIDKEKPCVFEIQVDVQPEFELPEYKGLEAKKANIRVNNTDVDKALKELRQHKAELVPLEEGETSKEEDIVFCDVNLKVDDELIWGKENIAIPAMDTDILGAPLKKESLVKKKVGDESTEKVTLPDDFRMKDHANKEGEISLKILDIKRVQLPEMDEEFLKEFEVENEEDLKKKIKEQIKEGKTREANIKIENELLEALIEKTKIDLPEKFLQERILHAKNDIRRRMSSQKKTSEEIDAHLEKEHETIVEDINKSIKQFLVIDKIALAENIEVGDDALDEHIKSIAEQQGRWPNEMQNFIEKHGLKEEIKSQIKQEKVLALLRENAKLS